MNRNRMVQGLGMLLLLPAALLSTAMAQEAAQNYPSRPVTLVIPYPAGGPNDLEGRLYTGKLATALAVKRRPRAVVRPCWLRMPAMTASG